MKICRTCGNEKLMSSFQRRRVDGQMVYDAKCIDCVSGLREPTAVLDDRDAKNASALDCLTAQTKAAREGKL